MDASNTGSCSHPFVHIIPTLSARVLPLEKSRDLPSKSVTLPPASLTIATPAE